VLDFLCVCTIKQLVWLIKAAFGKQCFFRVWFVHNIQLIKFNTSRYIFEILSCTTLYYPG
jgi:hypothetical protein